MATKYDGEVIGRMADALYSQAATVTFLYALAGLILGAVVPSVALLVFRRLDTSGLITLICGGFGFLVGLDAGRRAALRLRFTAQQALAMAEIERHLAALRAERIPAP